MFYLNDKETLSAIKFITAHANADTREYCNTLIDILKTDGIRNLNNKEEETLNLFFDKYKVNAHKGFSNLITWTPVGFKYRYICNDSLESIDITDYEALMCLYVDNIYNGDSSENINELLQYDIISFIITCSGIGNRIIIVDNISNYSENITDFDR